MKKYLLNKRVVVLITTVILLLTTNLFRSNAAGSVSGAANGATVNTTATVLGVPANVQLLEAAPVTLPSSGGNVNNQIASVNASIPGVVTILSTGVITNSSTGSINASNAHAQSTSTVNGLNILNSFITATTVQSVATSDGNGSSAISTGAGSIINELRINHVLQETSFVAPNTVISVSGVIQVTVGGLPVNLPLSGTVTLNKQTPGGNGTTTTSLGVTQIDVAVSGSVAGLISLNVNVSVAIASSGVNFTAAPNSCPNVNVSGGTNRTVQVGQTLSFNVSATDPDGDTVSLQASNLPANASFNPNPATGTPTATGSFSFTPSAGQANQTFNVSFTASDNRGCSGATPTPVTVQINVTPGPPSNSCPNISTPASPQTVQVGNTLSFTVSATDPDGNTVTLNATNLPSGATFTPNPASGTPTATGTFSFTPSAAQANQTFNVNFSAGDNNGCSASANSKTVQINVTPPANRCPNVTVPGATQTVQVGQNLTFTVSATDPDGNTVSLQASNLPANSSFSPNPATGTPTATGTFSFTPSTAQANQTFNVSFTASDNQGCSGGAATPVTVQINVTPGPPPNRCPIITVPSTTQTIQVGQTLTFNVSATDPDGDTTTLNATNLPSGATFTPNPVSGTPTATGIFQFTPASVQAGLSFNVQFTISDNHGCNAGASVTVQISVTPPSINHCPIVTVPSVLQIIAVGQTLTFPVSATDPDGDTVTLRATNMPAGATFVPNPATGTPSVTGVFSFTPTPAQAEASFDVQFTASDNQGCNGSGTVPITVTVTVPPNGNPNACPTISTPANPQTIQPGANLTFTVSATDPDGDTVTLSATNLPAGATFTPNPATGTPTATGTFSFTPSTAQANQTFNVNFIAGDNRGCSASGNFKTVALNIGNGDNNNTGGPCGNHAPIISVPALPMIGLGETLSFIVRATDQDGDAVTLSTESMPNNASFSASTGKFTFNPSENQLRQALLGQGAIVTFIASDSRGVSSERIVDITPVLQQASPKGPMLSVPAGPVLVRVVDRLTFGLAALAQIEGCSTSISASGLPASASFDSSTNLFTFAPTAAQMGQTFTVNFTATDCAGRKAQACVRIIVIDADSNCLARGSGIAEVTVKRIDFNSTKVGDCSGAVTVAVTNKGGGSLLISSVTLSDENNYHIEGFGALPVMLQPGGVIEFRVLFNPKDKGTLLGAIGIFTSDPDNPLLEIALKGKSAK